MNYFQPILYALIAISFLGLALGSNSSNTKITIFNPYSISAEMEVKCDYNWKVKKFQYYKKFVIKGKKNLTISVPNYLKQCQIWPKILLWQ